MAGQSGFDIFARWVHNESGQFVVFHNCCLHPDSGQLHLGTLTNMGPKDIVIHPHGIVVAAGVPYSFGETGVICPIVLRLKPDDDEVSWARELWKRLGLPAVREKKPEEVT